MSWFLVIFELVTYLENVKSYAFIILLQASFTLQKDCFLFTADGEYCGFTKTLASTGPVSTTVEPILDKLLVCGMKKLVGDN